MSTPEANLHRRLGSSDADQLQKCVEKMKAQSGDNRINPVDFRGIKVMTTGGEISLFRDEEIVGDIKAVQKAEADFARKASNFGDKEVENFLKADFVENIIPAGIKDFNWLGEKVKTILPSTYDDIFNHVDLILQMLPKEVAEKPEDLKCVGFSVDLTVSPAEAREKFGNLMMSLARDGQSRVKYFKTEMKTTEGEKEIKLRNFKLPRVIVSCSGEVLNEIQEEFMRLTDDENDESAKEKIKDCRLKYVVIQEIFIQLKLISLIFGKDGIMDISISYGRALTAFTKLMAEQGITPENIGQKTGSNNGSISQIVGNDKIDQFAQIIKGWMTGGNRGGGR